MKAMNKVREIKKQINEILKKKRINTKMSCGDNIDQIKRCITECYFYNSVRLNGNQYQNLRTGVNCYIHPTSTLYQVGLKPTYIIYHELLLTNQSYMKCVTSINGKWLLDLLPDFFTSFSSLN
jgi:pre-mRNA-splicing factor ATP-dependent RNA helicase DHX38/PRP16